MRFFIEYRSFAVGLVAGAAAGGATTLYCVRQDLIPKRLLEKKGSVTVLPPEQPPERRVPPLEARYVHRALKYGFGRQSLRYFDGFVAAFDSRTRNPSWVLEHLSWTENPQKEGDRLLSVFTEDPLIDKRFRNKLDDFRDSGYDRGHMAPAANHRSSQKAMNDTFTLTNISPQVGEGFNRSYWARFEKFARDLLKISSAVFIATGPMWLPEKESEGKYLMKYPMIGQPPALVSVPTHFYKVILAEPKDMPPHLEDLGAAECAMAAFVMPNRSIPEDVPLTRFAVPISDLEGATGLIFYPKYMTDEKRALLDRAALVWRSIGKALHGQANVPLLQTLEGVDPESKPAEVREPQPKKYQSISAKKCAMEPHLCYHAECTLPPPDWWKKKKEGQAPKV